MKNLLVFFTTKALSYNIWAMKVCRQAFRSRWSMVDGRRILPSVPTAQLTNISRQLTPCDQIFPLNKTIAGPSSLQLRT